MEAKESMAMGVTVIGAEAPSNYHVASRGEAPPQLAITTTTGDVTPVSVGMSGLMEKKKRGRPRKYGPDGSVSRSYSPRPTSASAPPSAGSQPSGKRGRGRSLASEAKHQPKFEMVSMGMWVFIFVILMLKHVKHVICLVVISFRYGVLL